jgi:hypothetical protein
MSFIELLLVLNDAIVTEKEAANTILISFEASHQEVRVHLQEF